MRYCLVLFLLCVSVKAESYSTTTWQSGGYSLALPPGVWVVTASVSNHVLKQSVVTVGVENVKWDVRADLPQTNELRLYSLALSLLGNHH